MALSSDPATLADGLRAFVELERELASELQGQPTSRDCWYYVQVASRLAAQGDAAAELELEVDAEALIENARKAAAHTGSAESGAQVELVWSALLAERGELLAAEAVAGDALARFPAAVGYACELRLNRARLLRRAARWDAAQDQLAELELHLATHAKRLAGYRSGYEAGLWGERGQIWIELGVLDKALDCLAEEERWASESGRTEDRLNAEQHRAELALVSHDFGGVERRTAPFVAGGAEADAISAERRALFTVIRAAARVERARVEPGYLPAAEEAVATVRAETGVAPAEQLRVELLESDLGLLTGDHDRARAALARAEALTAGWGAGGEPTLEAERVLVIHGARLARESGASPAELAPWARRMDGVLDSLLTAWDAAPTPPEGIGFLHLGERREVLYEKTLLSIAILGDEQGAQAALTDLLRAQAHGGWFQSTRLPAPSAAGVRASMPPGRGMLVYLTGKARSHLFVFDREHVAVVPLGSDDALRRVGRDLSAGLRRLVRSEDPVELAIFEGSLERAAESLLPDEARRLMSGWSAATIVGSELLHGPPLDCLPFGEGLLGEELALAYAPSVPLLDYVGSLPAAERADGDADYLLVGTLSVSDELQREHPKLARLPFGADEARRLLDAPRGWKTQRLLGDGASVDAIRGLDVAGPRVVQFLAHGAWEEELGSVLVLAGEGRDGIFGRREIAELRFGELVLLSACQASRGYERWGEDRLLHLGGAFLEAGARCVVLARTDVELRATVELKAALLRELAGGASPAEALRRARAELAGSGPRAERFRAGSFYALGDGHRPL
ncbi:MAG: CHAT domain-containing protein [Planctomycetota bacterium]